MFVAAEDTAWACHETPALLGAYAAARGARLSLASKGSDRRAWARRRQTWAGDRQRLHGWKLTRLT